MIKIKSTTFRGKAFLYEGDVNSSLKVFALDNNGDITGTVIHIDSETINFVKKVINEKSKIQMGACRDNPARFSLGEMLKERGKSPQWLSYLLPVLEAGGYIKHYKEGRAFWVRRA